MVVSFTLIVSVLCEKEMENTKFIKSSGACVLFTFRISSFVT